MCFCKLKTTEPTRNLSGQQKRVFPQVTSPQLLDGAITTDRDHSLAEILVPTTDFEPVNSKLDRIIKEGALSSTTLVARRFFNRSTVQPKVHHQRQLRTIVAVDYYKVPRLAETTAGMLYIEETGKPPSSITQLSSMFNDVDHLTASFIQAPTKLRVEHSEQGINRIINMKHILISIAYAAQAATCENRLLRTVQRLEQFSQQIDAVIEKNGRAKEYSCCPAESTIFCNESRTYKEKTNDIFEIEVEHNPSLKLMKNNANINDSLTDVYLMSDKIASNLCSNIRSDIWILYKAYHA
ncbi:MAG: hypothetical protein J3Q66DRAFT_392412 [Benniella sp.]|nr:MAG: hypothetical protein J3Q66DRAFT_392412 [Benniella sp.]